MTVRSLASWWMVTGPLWLGVACTDGSIASEGPEVTISATDPETDCVEDALLGAVQGEIVEIVFDGRTAVASSLLIEDYGGTGVASVIDVPPWGEWTVLGELELVGTFSIPVISKDLIGLSHDNDHVLYSTEPGFDEVHRTASSYYVRLSGPLAWIDYVTHVEWIDTSGPVVTATQVIPPSGWQPDLDGPRAVWAHTSRPYFGTLPELHDLEGLELGYTIRGVAFDDQSVWLVGKTDGVDSAPRYLFEVSWSDREVLQMRELPESINSSRIAVSREYVFVASHTEILAIHKSTLDTVESRPVEALPTLAAQDSQVLYGHGSDLHRFTEACVATR